MGLSRPFPDSIRRLTPTILPILRRSFAGGDGGYKSFGSFHSDDVEALIRLPADRYNPPKLPFDVEGVTFPSLPGTSTPFASSADFIGCYSHLDRDKWTFLNHGAFGLALDLGLRRANEWRMHLESQPLRHFDRYLLNHLAHGARRMVDFVTKDESDASRLREGVAMIQCVTGGLNAVIGGHARCTRGRGKVFYYDIAYGSSKKMCEKYHGRNGVCIPFEEEYLQRLKDTKVSSSDLDWDDVAAEVFIEALDSAIHGVVKDEGKDSIEGSMLILDHITSNTAVHFPIAAIAKYAKEEYGMICVVDGAHGLLGLPLDMGRLLSKGGDSGYIDVYLTNAHKWFSSPRGAALMFSADPTIRDSILKQPAVISHGVDGGFLSRFIWDGTRDYASQLTLSCIADHWHRIGVDNVRNAMKCGLREGVDILAAQWHPESVDDATLVPGGISAPMMTLVRLPDSISGAWNNRKTSTDAKQIQDFLYRQHIEVPIKCVRGVLYARVSCHLYNCGEEFDRLARALTAMNKQ